ncbi:hypothetical protein M6B38_168535 [Iris pallida]|uniref:Uncharacterized protein n=1 Tax=Iris pallida TaxID=29817 RepID=A0AAX6EVN3_IRIPA|nr:hypothetical protein M6B38_168535 [Iris pallida]
MPDLLLLSQIPMRWRFVLNCMNTIVWLDYLVVVLSLILVCDILCIQFIMACSLCILLRPSEDLVIPPGVCSYLSQVF